MLREARLAYSAAEIQQIASVFTGPKSRSDSIAGSPLRLLPGVPTTSNLGLGDTESAHISFGLACSASLELANVGTTTIQVVNIGFEYTSAPEPNPTVYRLVEACSVIQVEDCPGGLGGGPGECSVYYAHVKLMAGSAGSQFFSQPHGYDDLAARPCPAIALAPQATVTVLVDAYSPDPLLFHAVPAFDVLTASGRRVVTFPQFVYGYAFADASAFTCYRLQANTFVAWRSGLAAFDWLVLARQKAWCV